MKKQEWHSQIIEEYLKKYYSKDSRDTARVYLKHFFVTMNEEPEEFLKKNKTDITNIIWDYVQKIDKRPPKTQILCLSFMRQFLIRNRKAIDDVEWEDMRKRNQIKRGARAIVKKKTPTQNDLKKLLNFATGLKAKTIFALIAATGMRPDEPLSLTWKDIDMDERQVTIYGDNTKGKYDRVTFFTPEVKDLLELWKTERERLLQVMYKKSKYLRDKLESMGYEVIRADKGIKYPGEYVWRIRKNGRELTKDEIIAIDDRVFPYDYGNIYKQWVELLEKAGYPYNEKDTNPRLKNDKYLFNLHSLRRFWFTQMAGDRANEEYTNIMGGHESELNQTYKDFVQEPLRSKLKEEYEKHIGCVSIFEAPVDLSGVQEDLKSKDEKIKELENKLERLTHYLGLKEQLEQMIEQKINGKK